VNSVSYNPLYLQVKEVILKRIIDGIYTPGDTIPTETRLAKDFGTSISTIRQALSILVSEGFLLKKQGKGTFVSQRKTKIRFLSWLGESKRGQKIIDELIARFEKKYPAITVECIPTTYPETRRELVRMISNGEAPDVAQIVSPWTSYFASMGAFEELGGLLREENLKQRDNDRDLSGGLYQNKIYSVSWGLCPVSLIANKMLLEGAGIRIGSAPLSLDQFHETCTVLSEFYSGEGKYCYGLCISDDESDFLRIYTFLQAFQGGFVNSRGEVIFNARENVAGFQWLRDFIDSTSVLVDDIYILRRRFASDEIAFISDGPWIKYLLEELTGEDFEKKFKVIMNPVNVDDRSYSWNYNHALAICSQSKNKIYAARFIDEITSGPDISNYYYSVSGHLPVNRKYLNEPVFNNEYCNVFKRQLKYATVINAQNAMFEKAMLLCIDAVRKILFEGADIEKELNEKQYYLKMLYYG